MDPVSHQVVAASTTNAEVYFMMGGAISILSGVIALLYKSHLNDVKSRDAMREIHARELKELLTSSIECQKDMTMVVANNTRVMERYIDKGN